MNRPWEIIGKTMENQWKNRWFSNGFGGFPISSRFRRKPCWKNVPSAWGPGSVAARAEAGEGGLASHERRHLDGKIWTGYHGFYLQGWFCWSCFIVFYRVLLSKMMNKHGEKQVVECIWIPGSCCDKIWKHPPGRPLAMERDRPSTWMCTPESKWVMRTWVMAIIDPRYNDHMLNIRLWMIYLLVAVRHDGFAMICISDNV